MHIEQSHRYEALALVRIALVTMAVAWCHPTASYGQAMPELSVSLRGRIRETEGLSTEHLALLELELTPTARNGAGQPIATMTEFDPELETAPDSEIPLDPAERDEIASPTERPSAHRRGRDALTKQQLLLKDAPYVITPQFAREAVDAALRTCGVTSALVRLDSLSSRAKNSAVLPEVRLRAGRDTDQILRLSPTTDDPYHYSQSGGVSFILEGAVTWRLSKLVFTGEELSIERLRLAQSRERQRVTHVTLNELLAWQSAWRRTQAMGELAVHATEDLVEASVRLDVLTGGWFSAHQPDRPPPKHPNDEHGKSEVQPGRSPSPLRLPVAEGSKGTRSRSQATEGEKVAPLESPHLESLALSR